MITSSPMSKSMISPNIKARSWSRRIEQPKRLIPANLYKHQLASRTKASTTLYFAKIQGYLRLNLQSDAKARLITSQAQAQY